MAKPNVYVRSLKEDDRMQMNFNFGLPGKKEKTFNLNRLKNEELGKTLERITLGVSKYLDSKNKKQKKKAGPQDDSESQHQPLNVALFFENAEVSATTPNIEAWIDGSVLKLVDVEYNVLFNLPAVASLNLPQCIMAGFPIFPQYELEFANVEESEFIWSKASTQNCTVVTEAASCEDAGDGVPKNQNVAGTGKEVPEVSFVEVGRGLFYTSSMEDIGHRLKLTCMPASGDKRGDVVETLAPQVVDAGPGTCPFEDRQSYTRKHSERGSMRVMTYNVLADYYADSDYSRGVLFPQCPPYALAVDYRKQLFLKEILGYNADLICLQEMDRKIYHSDLSPALRMQGYHSMLKLKAGQVPEGCAMFYRDSKFRLLGQHDIDFGEAFEKDPLYQDILEKVGKSEPLKTTILAKGTTLQVAVLECLEIPGKKIVAMNTHFYFHPKSAHIRLIHSDMAMRHMKHVCEMYKNDQGETPAVIFCGDFNSTEETGVYRYFTDRKVAADDVDWAADGGEEYFGGIDIHHDYKPLSSACGTPPFTNYTMGFQGCLDYVFIDSDQLETSQVIPLPSEEVVTQHVALPNILFPSDHLAVVCDLKWKSAPR